MPTIASIRAIGCADRDVIAKLGDIAAAAGLRRIAILAWRDLDDPEAGGSELHAVAGRRALGRRPASR